VQILAKKHVITARLGMSDPINHPSAPYPPRLR